MERGIHGDLKVGMSSHSSLELVLTAMTCSSLLGASHSRESVSSSTVVNQRRRGRQWRGGQRGCGHRVAETEGQEKEEQLSGGSTEAAVATC